MKPSPIRAALGCGVILSIAAAGCAGPKLTRRYDSMLDPVSVAEPIPGLAGFVRPPSTRSVSGQLGKLSADGQAAMVKAISGKTETLGALVSGVSGKSTTPRTDFTKFSRRIVVSVDKRALCPSLGSRIDKLDVALDMGADARWTAWDKFATVYETIDLGKVNLSQSSSLKTTLGASAREGSPTPGSASVEYTRGSELAEEVKLRHRRVALTGILDDKRAELLAEGVSGIDLDGNLAVDISFKVPQSTDEETLTIATYDSAGKPKLAFRDMKLPGCSGPLLARLAGSYRLRRVVRGEQTIGEQDDDVQYEVGDFCDRTIELLSADDLSVPLFLIGATARRGPWLEADPGSTLAFGTYDEAERFLDKIEESALTVVDGRDLTLAGRSITADQLSGLHVFRSEVPDGRQCSPPSVGPCVGGDVRAATLACPPLGEGD